ncbi:hybrid sensor histidine kinase/response regulator [Reyranella sp.]|uniref:hybrid sensor histidine kinase/response regulator n=1 Tax=Reyranella sp. TaxID=1929291 RepID=UPI003D0F701D
MLAEPAVLALSLAYLGLLFAVAYFGDRHQRAWSTSAAIAPTVYGLSLAIYCTSWTFYGAVGRAATAGFDFILIYTGPVLVITAGYPMVAKMVRLAKQHNVTSIADFLASRYGKSRAVGVIATLFATVGVLPYIALQLQAVSSTFRTVAEPTRWIDGRAGVIHTDTSLIVAALMAVFTILFGVRNVQASEQHRGMMLAIAFESVVKLIALLTVGPFVLFVLFDGPSDLWAKLSAQPAIAEQLTREGTPLTWIVTSLLSGMAFLCLPRQFHVAVVEHGHPASLRTARWLFPAYLVLINLFVLPIAAAGLLLLGPQVNPDLYVLRLPLGHGQSWLSTLVFIGGLSAATSMVVVACMALAAMIGNELLMPYVLRSRAGAQEPMGPMVVFVRRAAVVLILMAGYAYERIISGYLPLASIGLISFCAVANFAPGLVLGLYWRRAHRYGVVAGLAGGFVVWLYALLLPSLQATAGGPAAPLQVWLPPLLAGLDPVGQGFVVGILVNTLLLVGVSLLVRARGADAEQADAFVLGAEPEPPARPTPADAQRLSELRELLARFVGSERALRALGSGPISLQAATAQAEHLLSGTLGAASARVIVGAFGRRGRLLGRSARALIDEASEAIRYNYDILRNSLDHVGMGIAAFDKDGRLEISNDRFATLLPLDHALLRRPDTPLTHEVATPDGLVVELRLDPLPGGGFVATCNDVTARVRTAEALHDSDRQLRRAAETLEQRVAERTAELEASRAEAEAANLGKTRFIAAASHDLLQPLHAARLFTAAMIDRDPGNDLGSKIDASLGAVEALLDALLDISKLDAGAFKPEKRPFALQPMFESLATAFAPVAARRDVDLVIVRTGAFVDTDPAFLRRILQNLLSNALRYGGVEGRAQRVLLGCRREGDFLRLEVRDNGPGIAVDKQAIIFDEFVRLQPEDDRPREERGLGLGLAIVDRIARMLELPVRISSAPGEGSTFSVLVPRVAAVAGLPLAVPPLPPRLPVATESFVLCIDNEARVREAMAALLGGWGCRVATAATHAEALACVGKAGRLPDLMLADLHLDEGPDGLELIELLRKSWNRAVPAALITADRDPMLRARARSHQVELLHKPVKPAALRALLRMRERTLGLSA